MMLSVRPRLKRIFRDEVKPVLGILWDSDSGQLSKWLQYRLGWTNCIMYDDVCPMTPARIICMIDMLRYTMLCHDMLCYVTISCVMP